MEVAQKQRKNTRAYMTFNCIEGKNSRTGSVLILVLIVTSCITILAIGLAYRTRIELKLAQKNAQRTQVYYLALGGIERVKALLSQQKERSSSNTAVMCRFTGTVEEEKLFDGFKDSRPDENNLLTYCLRDEQGYLNINKSDPAAWEKINGVSKELHASILDWTDTDNDTNPDGAETNFYERLNPPYVSKNSLCVILKELLFIKGITRENYLGEHLTQSSLAYKQEATGQFNPFFNDYDNTSNLGFLNIFTVYGNGKININTVSKEILSALPGIAQETADTLSVYCAGPDGQPGTDDDQYPTGEKDLTNLENLPELQIEILQQYCCFNSEYFRIFSFARLDNIFECCLMATVKCAGNQPALLYLERLL